MPESLAKKILSLNDLTIENLKLKAKEVEGQLNECRARIAEKQTSIIQQETELQTVKFKSDQTSIQRHSGPKFPKNSTFQNAQISIFANFKA